MFQLFSRRIADLMQLIREVAFRKLDQRLAALLLGKGQRLHHHHQLADEQGSVREIVPGCSRTSPPRVSSPCRGSRSRSSTLAGLRRIAGS